MTLLQLKYFTAVCSHGSVSAAAENLYLSQPSLSAAIRELEQEFGVPLFRRHHRGMELTPEGAKLFSMAQSLLAQSEQTQRLMAELGKGRKVLRLGIPPMIGSLLLPRLFRDFLPTHPEVTLTITEEGRRDLLTRLEEEQLDMVLLPHDRPLQPSLSCLPVGQVETVCCVCGGHSLAALDHVRPEDLSHTPLVLFQDSFFQTEVIKDWFARAQIRPHILLQTRQLSTLQSVVASTNAAGFLFRPLLEGQSRLLPIPLAQPVTTQVSLVWNRQSAHFSAMELLRDFLSGAAPLLKA